MTEMAVGFFFERIASNLALMVLQFYMNLSNNRGNELWNINTLWLL